MLRNFVPSLGLTSALALLTGCPRMASEADVRVVHASPDAPAVDVCADGSELFEGAEFPAATAYATVPAGSYDISVIPAGAGCDTAGVIEATLNFASGTDTTVVAINTLDEIEAIVLTDDNSAPDDGLARVRFVHASPDAPTVDITLADGTTLFDDVSFGENGGYIEVDAGTYDLEVRDETGTVTVLELPGVELEDGAVYTIFAIGFLAGDPDLDVLVTIDNE
jgi:hypothetical protein